MDVSHFVCTHEEAEELIRAQAELWLSDCGCRAAAKDKCRSRTDVCLGFVQEANSGGGNLRLAKVADALEVLAEAGRHHLVTRPFADNPALAGSCAPGRLVAVPDEATCDGCGVCVPVCYFGARSKQGALIDSARCAGCGLCVGVCPAGATTMEKREAAKT